MLDTISSLSLLPLEQALSCSNSLLFIAVGSPVSMLCPISYHPMPDVPHSTPHSVPPILRLLLPYLNTLVFRFLNI